MLAATEATMSAIKSEIVNPESSIVSTGVLLMVTNMVELVCCTVATVITSL